MDLRPGAEAPLWLSASPRASLHPSLLVCRGWISQALGIWQWLSRKKIFGTLPGLNCAFHFLTSPLLWTRLALNKKYISRKTCRPLNCPGGIFLTSSPVNFPFLLHTAGLNEGIAFRPSSKALLEKQPRENQLTLCSKWESNPTLFDSQELLWWGLWVSTVAINFQMQCKNPFKCPNPDCSR